MAYAARACRKAGRPRCLYPGRPWQLAHASTLTRQCAHYECCRPFLLAVSRQTWNEPKLFQGAVLFEGNVRSTWG